MSSPMDLHTTDAESHRGESSIEKKYLEIKQRNQKLMEYVQNQEKEHKTQIQSLKSKLDESKSTIRKLEDDNLSLKFQLSGAKEKESQYIKQISEMKMLLRKYYNKVHSTEVSEEQEPTIGRHPHKLMSLKVTTCKPLTSSPTTSTQENELQSPKTAALPRKNRLGIHERKNSASNISLSKKVESASAALDKNRPPLIKVKSAFSRENGSKGSIDDEIQLNSEASIQGSNISRETDLRKQAGLLLEETKSSLLEDKVRTLNHLPSKLQTPLFDALDVQRPQSLVLDHSGFAKTLEHFLEEGYRRKFNMLSQNIVALNVKPEISLKDLEEMRVSRTIGDLDDVNLVRRSFLRYVSKTYPPPDATTPKMRKKSVDKAMPLFQDFFVIGVDRDDLNAHIKQNPEQYKASLKPKILYSYPSPLASTNEPPKASVPEFAFPFGVDVKRLKSTPSFTDLNSVLFASNDYELRYKCFVFPLLSSSNSDEQSMMGDVIEKSNPNHLLYIVCINFQDYVNMSTAKPDQPKSLKDIKYWQTQKIMCFVTYYPYINLFFDILIAFFRILKVEREVKLNEAKSDDITRHAKLDADFTIQYLHNVVQKNLHEMLAKNFHHFGKHYEIKIAGSFLDFPVKFHLDEASRASILEAIWGCVPVFSYLSLKDLLWFFAAFMLEKKMVFLSKNIFLLTATLSVIRSLIKPFKYPFPLIFNLPEVLMVLCDAPGAALIGINQGEEFLKNENLFEDYPSCIFVCLDEEKVYMDKANKPELAKFENFEKSLLTHYAKLNSNLNYQILEPSKSKSKQSKKTSIKLTSNEEVNEKCKKILEVFKTTIEEKIINYIPPAPIYAKDNELDYDKLTDHMLARIPSYDKPFLKQFLKTQIFTYYLEQHFENSLDQTNGI